MEEGSTEIGKRNDACSRPEKTSVDRPVDRRRDRSTGLSTGVHDVHRISPIDRSIERSTDLKQAALGLGPIDRPIDRGHGSVDRPVDRQTRFGFPFWIRILFLFGIEFNRGFLIPCDSVAINKG